jgi:hypothetical protein
MQECSDRNNRTRKTRLLPIITQIQIDKKETYTRKKNKMVETVKIRTFIADISKMKIRHMNNKENVIIQELNRITKI